MQVAVRDRAAERRVLRAVDVDVDPLVVAGHVGERVDVLLGHLVPVGGAEDLALGGLELFESGDRPHGGPPYFPPWPLRSCCVTPPDCSIAGSSPCPIRSRAPTATQVKTRSSVPVNMTLWCVEKYRPRAVILCCGPEGADYGTRRSRPTTPLGPRCPTTWRGSGPARPHLRARSDGSVAEPRGARGGRPAGRPGRASRPRRAARDDVHRRPGHVPVRNEQVSILLHRARQEGPGQIGAAGVRKSYGIDPEAGAGLHRAARGPVGRAAGRDGDRRQDRRRPAAPQGRPRARDPGRDPLVAFGAQGADRTGGGTAYVS